MWCHLHDRVDGDNLDDVGVDNDDVAIWCSMLSQLQIVRYMLLWYPPLENAERNAL